MTEDDEYELQMLYERQEREHYEEAQRRAYEQYMWEEYAKQEQKREREV